ncbi:DnaJ-like protein subfamily C member 14 [Heterocephalus glaber]|uniref:DnaJ-like protein subfamily C member 14 n=1 Tax=Heterocephalus glaber TaxID=10181 RepID=G5AMN8_HETGA|nr:DnaJ-like protein subfamily C member 14 [Heterocephalus glaber]
MLGLKIICFALMDGKVYDITEWAGYQRVVISPDTHRVPYHISFGSSIPGTSGQQRGPSDTPPADLQGFLSRIFQVPPGQMSKGNFFAAPQPGCGATAASKPNSTVPKGEAKPKRRKKHRRFEMDRESKSARYCAECNRLHPAEEGDFGAEASMLGLKIICFALMDGKVYDITEWAGYQRVVISPDTHRVPYHISFGSSIPGTSGQQRGPSDTPPADLQGFLSRIFQVPPGQMSKGNFFAAPQPGCGATAASKPNSTVPKGEAKPKRRKKVRRPFQP